MGLTKQYLRYVPSTLWNIVASPKCNVVFVRLKNVDGRFLAVGACQHIFVWDTRKAEKAITLSGSDAQVCVLENSPDHQHLAVGYQDGSIRIFDLHTSECKVTFQGHKSAVTCLSYDNDGGRLASGSKDTEVVLWDIVNESGMFRLRGHKGEVTRCRFLMDRNILVSSSKDTFVKFWDLDIQHCFKTMVGHHGEVWDFVFGKQEDRLISGSSDSELRMWKLMFCDKEEDSKTKTASNNKTTSFSDGNQEKADVDDSDDNDILSCSKVGSLMRQGRDRVSSMIIDPGSRLLACHGNSGILELFKFLPDDEVKRRLARKQRKARKKLLKEGIEITISTMEPQPSDEVVKLGSIKVSGKIKSFDFVIERDKIAKIALLLNNNTVEVHEIDLSVDEAELTLKTKISLPGHRTDVRTLCFSADNTAVLSASGECLKIWNRATSQCIRTMQCDYALCSTFVPGDRHCIIGTKSGKLQLFDIAGSVKLEDVDAHQGAVWSICLAPDQRGFVSGSADKEVKFWEFELVADSDDHLSKSKRLTIIHTRTLQLSDDVLSVRLSQDGRLLAVSLLDSTVKVFFVDTLKFFLSLYGHKFPVLCMDISEDSTLIATGSADRNIKIWGLDFGDCHRSLFAHDDSIMCLQFIPKTHMLFSGGKDGAVKQWDADNFEKITTLKGHIGAVWAIAISPNGHYVSSSSHDGSIRLWEKTEEILVLEEEREMEREAEFEKTLASGEETVIPGETNTETGMATKKTAETVKSAEKLMESIDVYREEIEKLKEHKRECEVAKKHLPAPVPHPMMMAYKTPTPLHFVLHVCKQIKSSELEEALLVLPFSYVIEFLTILNDILEKEWSVELCCRCLFFLLRVHHGEITTNQVLLPVIDKLRNSAQRSVKKIRDAVGFNMAGLSFLQHEIEAQEEVQLFADATQRFNEKKRKRKKREDRKSVV